MGTMPSSWEEAAYQEADEAHQKYITLKASVHALLTYIQVKHPEGWKNGVFNWSCPYMKALADQSGFKGSQLPGPTRLTPTAKLTPTARQVPQSQVTQEVTPGYAGDPPGTVGGTDFPV